MSPGALRADRPGVSDARSQPRAIGLDIIGGEPPRPGTRPMIGVYFACARKYVRVLRNHRGDGYLARCPSCGKTIRFAVGPGGRSERFFEVSC